MIATIINTNVNKLSYVTYISTTPSARLRNEWKAVPPSCLGKYIILLWSPGSSGECREDFFVLVICVPLNDFDKLFLVFIKIIERLYINSFKLFILIWNK